MVLADSGSDTRPSAKGIALSLLETSIAKEAKNEFDCLGKPLDCSFWRCTEDCSADLSGDPVPRRATPRIEHERETADLATFQLLLGKSYRT